MATETRLPPPRRRATPQAMTRTAPPRLRPGFWRDTPLDRMNRAEWEALCDRCGRCCLIKLEDEDSAEIAWTNVHCRLYDPTTCACGNYALRRTLVPGCVKLTAETLPDAAPWMPVTCAYRLLHEGADLPDWHPLVTGDPDSTRRAGMTADGIHRPGRLIPEWEVDEDDLQDHVIEGTL